ncbi:hypothetical protein [Nocardioides houyundeii]|uniref:hypothetical protein n=1 Tax=Nocardioides houyundeii TaxID=2045452 RepID=UPI000DF2FC13|nr:hypothetical protein [Nocardioides houyundeii]
MSGPQRARLDEALTGARPTLIGSSGGDWMTTKDVLDSVADYLKNMGPKMRDAVDQGINTETGAAIEAAFLATAEVMSQKGGDFQSGGQALDRASAALAAAVQVKKELDADPLSPPAAFVPNPEWDEAKKGLEKGKHDALVTAHSDAVAAQEEKARAAVDNIFDEFEVAAATMKKIHGEPDLPPVQPPGPQAPANRPPLSNGGGGGGPQDGAVIGTLPPHEPLPPKGPHIPQAPGDPSVPPPLTPPLDPPDLYDPPSPQPPHGPNPTPTPHPTPSPTPPGSEPGVIGRESSGNPYNPVPGGSGAQVSGSPAVAGPSGGSAGAFGGAVAGGAMGASVRGASVGASGSVRPGATGNVKPIGSTSKAAGSSTLGKSGAVGSPSRGGAATGASSRAGTGSASRGAAAGGGSRAAAAGGRGATGSASGRGSSGGRSGAAGAGGGARAAGRSGAGAAAGGAARGGSKKQDAQDRDHLIYDQDWLDDEGTAPGVLD